MIYKQNAGNNIAFLFFSTQSKLGTICEKNQSKPVWDILSELEKRENKLILSCWDHGYDKGNISEGEARVAVGISYAGLPI